MAVRIVTVETMAQKARRRQQRRGAPRSTGERVNPYNIRKNTRHASACKRTPAGFLLPMNFTQPAIDLDAQLALMTRHWQKIQATANEEMPAS